MFKLLWAHFNFTKGISGFLIHKEPQKAYDNWEMKPYYNNARDQGGQKVIPRLAASTSMAPGTLLEKQTPGPYSRPAEPRIVCPASCVE